MKYTLTHGGQLSQIAIQYAIPIDNWLDLSTGISPLSFPVSDIPQTIWQRLPEENADLIVAAQQYYQCQHILPISGSQAVIQLLPKLVSTQGTTIKRVFIPHIGYQEHRKSWQDSHCEIINYQDIRQLTNLTSNDVVILINPNNPTGKLYTPKEVEDLFKTIKQVNSLLLIDEAFMDCTPSESFIKHTVDPHLIILRSIGKFFGLAGIRLGFVAAAPYWLEQLSYLLGPWSVNGPAQYIGQQALTDITWQQNQRKTLQSLSEQLNRLLTKHFHINPTGTLLFKTIQHNNAPQIFEALCQQGVYVRLCDENNALRFGMPLQQQFPRLEQALDTVLEK